MNILMVTSEAFPFSKSGGLADVAGSLPPALVSMGHDAIVFVPSYNTPVSESGELECVLYIPMLAKMHRIEIRTKTEGSVKFCFVCHPFFNNRKGIYGDTSFTPYPDNFARFSVFDKAALEYCRHTLWKPDIIHCHDWTAGLVPYMMKVMNDQFFKNTKTVFTIHNLAYQGTFARMDFMLTEATPDPALFSGNQINMMQSGIAYSDFITTVSPTYSKEIQTKEQGCNLDNLLVSKQRCLRGIVNGIDIQEWNPESDKYTGHSFSYDNMTGKALIKAELQKTFSLPVAPDVPLFAMISRLASQKGFDVLLECLEEILRENRVQFIIIGTGDSRLENELKDIEKRNSNISVNILFSNKAAHIAEAGSDFFLMPSKYEPCGLNQLYSLRYGTIPVARRTGGLADTIKDIVMYPDSGTGILFDELSANNIKNSVRLAVDLYGTDKYAGMQRRAMTQDFSWNASAKEYVSVYEKICENSFTTA